MAAPERERRRPHRGIFLLPNLFTTGGLFAGFYAIIAAMQGQFIDAAIAVFVAGILDGLDGRIARMTGTQSEFGVQYDSLADLVSFGMAPALVMYAWSLSLLRDLGPTWGKVGWAAAFLYAACAALRLARFNTQVGVIDKRYFQGLASPAAAGLMMAFVWTLADSQYSGADLAPMALALTVIVALLMVSRIRYYSFKSLPLGDRVPFIWIPLLVGIFVLLAIDPPRVLLTIGVAYVLSGPVMTLWGLRRWRERRDPATRGEGGGPS
ncbi:MAG TPA: CDP-diacylglycerol--serine O-phosphatidyltransferase [Xanthomonadaceae bacterium]|nr:CDP-diacylglycerol--serine O-phosphatidyltransferase [Xanthomonadaceae bacterium]